MRTGFCTPFGFLILAVLPLQATPMQPPGASSLDPATIIDAIRRGGDLQTRLPAFDEVVVPGTPFTWTIPGATATLWVAAAIGVALTVSGVARGVSSLRDRRNRALVPGEPASGDRDLALERMTRGGAEADELARQGRFGDAMHALLLQGLVELHQGLGVALSASLTSREILRRTALDADGKAGFAELIRRVESVHFGAGIAGRADYAACRGGYDRLVAAAARGSRGADSGARPDTA